MAEDAQERLKVYRDQIDQIDVDLVHLLNKRTRVVHEIGRVKQECQMSVYEPKREELVYENITRSNEGPLPNDAVKRVFERIMDEMRSVQRNRMLEEQKESK